MTTPAPPVSRTLMAAVIIMGVMIVLGTAGLIGVIAHRAMSGHAGATHKASLPDQPYQQATASPSGPGEGVIYHGGGHIVSQSVRPDGSVMLVISNGSGDRVLVWHPETGQITAQLSLVP